MRSIRELLGGLLVAAALLAGTEPLLADRQLMTPRGDTLVQPQEKARPAPQTKPRIMPQVVVPMHRRDGMLQGGGDASAVGQDAWCDARKCYCEGDEACNIIFTFYCAPTGGLCDETGGRVTCECPRR